MTSDNRATHSGGSEGFQFSKAVQGFGNSNVGGIKVAIGTSPTQEGQTDNMGGHSHLHVFPSSAYTTAAGSAAHTHVVAGDLASGGGLATSSVGGGNTIANISKYLGVQWMVKT